MSSSMKVRTQMYPKTGACIAVPADAECAGGTPAGVPQCLANVSVELQKCLGNVSVEVDV